ncbi:MAG: helix-turn-helix domain-containing protein [Chloroflexi bacterium]|nr:helix-turn-helix domain-containing protein [Chloroflexota bacterium]
MDGYTVEEAASVLGVPRERVWELLARGILSGSADLGGGMRVRLKSDASPAPTAPAVERPIDAAAGPVAELTPFRELLTEFRSLTERYGQALLALGEARGEVAGLRSRVDMLEARVDLRLPSGTAPTSSSWSTPWPVPTERVVEPPAPRPAAPARPPEEATAPEHEESGAAPVHDEEVPHRRRGRAARWATESFADALARAQDPSIPELPGAAETAAALAAMRQDQLAEASRAAEPDVAERDADALPRELPSAEQVPVADEAEPRAEPSTGAVERAATGEEAAEPAAEVETAAAAQAEEGEPTAATVAEAGDGAEAASVPELAWDPEVYSAAIEEPGWISADDVPVAPTDAAPRPGPEPRLDAVAREADAEAAAPLDAPTEPRAEPPAPVAARAPADRQVSLSIESSGSRKLDEGLAALDAPANPQPPAPDAEEESRERAGAGAGRMEPGGRATAIPRSQVWRPSPPLTNRSSASRAYRRLRRIFPT